MKAINYKTISLAILMGMNICAPTITCTFYTEKLADQAWSILKYIYNHKSMIASVVPIMSTSNTLPLPSDIPSKQAILMGAGAILLTGSCLYGYKQRAQKKNFTLNKQAISLPSSQVATLNPATQFATQFAHQDIAQWHATNDAKLATIAAQEKAAQEYEQERKRIIEQQEAEEKTELERIAADTVRKAEITKKAKEKFQTEKDTVHAASKSALESLKRQQQNAIKYNNQLKAEIEKNIKIKNAAEKTRTQRAAYEENEKSAKTIRREKFDAQQQHIATQLALILKPKKVTMHTEATIKVYADKLKNKQKIQAAKENAGPDCSYCRCC